MQAQPGDTLWRIACRTLGVPNTTRYFYQLTAETERLKTLNPALPQTIEPGTPIRTR